MDILLFNQYFSSKKESSQKKLTSLPINLLCLATFLKTKGMPCKIYELGVFNSVDMVIDKGRTRFGLSDKEIIEIIKKENPRVIGVGCMYSQHYIDVVNIAKLIKDVDPLIKVVIGGNHATGLCDMVLKSPYFDFVVRGEGEITFYELCNALIFGESKFSRINGVSYIKNGKIIRTPDREFVDNLDDLPMIDYSLVDMHKYLSISTSPFVRRPPVVGIMSSRGCPGRCVYCTVKAVWGRSWRGKSPENTVDEIEFLYNKYGVREFAFLDDSASINRLRWEGICDEIINRKLDIAWSTPNGIAHWTLDKDILRKMKAAGCYRVTFGIESGNIETRKFLGKPYPLSQAKELIQYANKIGMWTICTNILGFPYETKEQMHDTIKFAKRSGTDFAAFYSLSPIVTSDVYNYFKKEELLDYDFVFKDNNLDEEKYETMYEMLNDGGAPTKYFKAEEIKKIQMKAYRSFIIYRAFTFLNPLRLINKIRSVEDFKYAFRLSVTGIKLMARSFYKKTTRALLD